MGYHLNQPIFLSALSRELGLDYSGKDIEILSVSSYLNATQSSLTFLNHAPDNIKACVAIASPSFLLSNQSNFPIVSSENPRLDFIKALSFLSSTIGFSHFDFTSKVHPSVKLGQNVVIEPGCVISKGVTIEHNVTIHSGTRIGKNSRIRSNSSIGGDGFGFERLDNGVLIRFKHLGGVEIGENVEVGSLTSIARGSLGDTIIGNSVKIDNLVHIAHNCHIHDGVLITACSELSGSVTVGKDSWIGPNSSILNKVTVGSNSMTAIGSVVVKDVPSNKLCAGNPARAIKDC